MGSRGAEHLATLIEDRGSLLGKGKPGTIGSPRKNNGAGQQRGPQGEAMAMVNYEGSEGFTPKRPSWQSDEPKAAPECWRGCFPGEMSLSCSTVVEQPESRASSVPLPQRLMRDPMRRTRSGLEDTGSALHGEKQVWGFQKRLGPKGLPFHLRVNLGLCLTMPPSRGRCQYPICL